jgi:hypothetical protein
MSKSDPLEEFIKRRELRPAAALVSNLGVKRTNDAKQISREPVAPEKLPPPEVRRQEPTKMELKPAGAGLQPAMDYNGPQFRAPRVVIPPITTKEVPPPPAPERKIDPLERFIAQRPKPDVQRPAEKLVLGRTRGMQM